MGHKNRKSYWVVVLYYLKLVERWHTVQKLHDVSLCISFDGWEFKAMPSSLFGLSDYECIPIRAHAGVATQRMPCKIKWTPLFRTSELQTPRFNAHFAQVRLLALTARLITSWWLGCSHTASHGSETCNGVVGAWMLLLPNASSAGLCYHQVGIEVNRLGFC